MNNIVALQQKESEKNKRGIEDDDSTKDEGYPDYRAMPTAQSAQQVLRLLEKNWKSFFKSIKDWSKNKGKYTGKPKLPKYKKKCGRNILILTNQNAKLKEGALKLQRNLKGLNYSYNVVLI